MKDVEKFHCPKPFQGNFLLLQKNNREQWKNFRPKKIAGLRVRSKKIWPGAPLFNV